jgi:hypothetical protein
MSTAAILFVWVPLGTLMLLAIWDKVCAWVLRDRRWHSLESDRKDRV